MSNHVHLLLTPRAAGNVAKLMQQLGRRYVRLFNMIHERSGTLWEGRYKACLVDSESYYFTCHRYIELNPVRAGLVRAPADYAWSSHQHYALGRPDGLLTAHELYRQTAAGALERQRAFRELFHQPVDDDTLEHIRSRTNQGWALGSDRFLDEASNLLGRSVRPPKRGRPFNGATAGSGQNNLDLTPII